MKSLFKIRFRDEHDGLNKYVRLFFEGFLQMRYVI
jgi:hypothetical protein